MIPILYESTERAFTTNGLGTIPDCVSCIVTEQLNGEFELELVYPLSGLHADLLEHDRLILAEPADGRDPEPFRIYRIEADITGQLTINARHISYWLSDIPVLPFSANSLAETMAYLSTRSAITNPFSFSTDIAVSGEFWLDSPKSIRSILGDDSGGILATYGSGEYLFNRFNVRLLSRRGENRDVVVRYGKNLTDLNQEKNIENLLTGVCPFWKKNETVVTLPEGVVTVSSGLPYDRVAVVDFTNQFEEEPTEEELRTAAAVYISQYSVGVPDVSIKISFVALWQTEEYKDIAPLERVYLGDTVGVMFEKLGISTSAEVVETEYNVLLERYESIVVGSPQTSFAQTFVASEVTTEEKIVAVRNDIDEATALITGNKGGYVVIKDTSGDGKPDEILVMDAPKIEDAQKIWRWNLGGLGYSSAGYEGPYGLAITQNGEIVADFIKVGVLSDRAGKFALDFTNATGIELTDGGSGSTPSLKVKKSSNDKQSQLFSEALVLYADASGDTYAWLGANDLQFVRDDPSFVLPVTTEFGWGVLNVTNGSYYMVFNASTGSWYSNVSLSINGNSVLTSGDLDIGSLSRTLSDLNDRVTALEQAGQQS